MRKRLLRRYSRWIVRHPWVVVSSAFLFTAFCLTISILFLKTQTGILDLYSDKNPINRRFIEYTQKFGAAENLIIVFEGGSEKRRHEAMDALAARLKEDPNQYIRELFYKVDLQLFQKHAFEFLSESQLKTLLGQVKSENGFVRGLFSAADYSQLLSILNQAVESGLRGAKPADHGKVDQFDQLLKPIDQLNEGVQGKEFSPAEILSGLDSDSTKNRTVDSAGYLSVDDHTMQVMMIRPVDHKQDYKIAQKLVEWVRQEISNTSPAFSDVKIGVTGGPALNHDQFQISQKDMTWASIIAFLSTAIIFFLAFKEFARPLLGLLTLAINLVWVFGMTTLTVGHLNLFSLAFVVILVGQGTYYGVHVVARYEEELNRGRTVAEAIEAALTNIFGNVTTSALTTAAAFFATMLVEMKGFAELGWIAGMGILLSAFSMQFLLPAFLVLYDRRRELRIADCGLRNETNAEFGMRNAEWGRGKLWARNGLYQHGGYFVVGILMLSIWGGYRYFSPKYGISFDHNLLNLQAKNTEAVQYEKRLIHTSLSPRAGILMAGSYHEAEKLVVKLRSMPTVQRVDWLGNVLPKADGEIASLQQQLRDGVSALFVTPLQPFSLDASKQQLLRLRGNLETIENRALQYSQGEKLLAGAEKGIGTIDAMIASFFDPCLGTAANNKIDCHQVIERGNKFQTTYFKTLRDFFLEAAKTSPFKFSEVPPELRDKFVSADGTYAIYAYPNVNIWEREPLEKFVADLRAASASVTGPPVMFYEILQLVKKDYFRAAFYSAVAIFLIFLLDFRSLRYSLLAFFPLVLGVFTLFGMMSVLGLQFNTANMIALPMILGIGADNGVHLIHRFREEGETNINFLFKSTGKALLITYLDSVTSFVGLAFASHQGVAQLGQVVLLGLTSCTIAGIIFLPAVMGWIIRYRKLRQLTLASGQI